MTTTEERQDDLTVRGGIGAVSFFFGFMVALPMVVLVGLAVIAFGSDSLDTWRAAHDVNGDTSPGAETVFVATEFAFDPDDALQTSDLLDMVLVNKGEIFHNLLIEEVRGFVLEAEAGVTSRADVQLAEGVYTIYCSVPGHRDLGMEATLTIAPG